MSDSKRHCRPMSHKKATHLLNPLRGLVLSPARLARQLLLCRDAQVLELGPGPGYFSGHVARSVPDGRLTLVDIQPEMLALAQKRLSAMGLQNVSYIQADAIDLPLENETFDVAFLVDVLGEVSDRVKCIGELYRILKRGGLLSITEQPWGHDFVALGEVKRLVGDKAFSLEKIFGRSRNYTINFRKKG